MRLTTASLLSLLFSLSLAITFDCKNIREEKVKWNLEKLGGQHQVSWIRHHPSYAHITQNTTFKISICEALELTDKDEKKDCRHGTRICNIDHEIDEDNNDQYKGAWPISREDFFENAHIEPKITRLKKEGKEGELGATEGVEIVMGGGYNVVDQKADITFICDKESKDRRRRNLDVQDDEGEGGGDKKEPYHKDWEDAKKSKDGAGGTIEFVRYKDAVLELEWTTPYACENVESVPDKDKEPGSDNPAGKSGGWGFFSWFFFLIFLLLSGFLVFTAWVNYSRNGARGCDLLPFSDTLRDLPYILGDWWRKIASTLGGSGTRGGYSAV